MKKGKIFIACDTSDPKKIKKIIYQLKKSRISMIPKFGMQFFYSKKGRSFLENFKGDYWLDLKICDVPNTALSAVESLKDLKRCKFLTAHASGGLEMLRVVKKKAKKINNKTKVLGVTILTSLNNKAIRELGYTKTIKQIVLKQADLIKKAGCDGIVCSAEEAKIVRKKYNKLFIVTPGIRLPGDKNDDQARIVTPYEALVKNKVSAIVMGRSLTRGNIKKNIQKLIDHLNQ